MRIAARVGRLERELRASRPQTCAECGGPPRWGEVQFTINPPQVVNHMSEVVEEPIDPLNDFCQTCGRKLVFRLRAPRTVLDRREGSA